MKGFSAFYLWGMHAKFFMGLYFAAMVFLSGILVAVYGGDSLRLSTLLQMFLVSIVIAFTQVLILPVGVDFSRGILFGRSILWLVFSTACVIAVSLFGGWFTGLPAWCPWLLGIFMLFGCSAMLLGLKFEQNADTLRLNDMLSKYQR